MYFCEINPVNLAPYVIGYERSYFHALRTLRLDRIIVAYPWILVIALLLWLWSASSKGPVPALRVDSEPEGTARHHFLKEQERQKQLTTQEAGEG